jgi:hypothetical protein
MKLSTLLSQYPQLVVFGKRACPDWVAQYVWDGKLYTTIITVNDSIIKVLDDRYWIADIV